MDLSINWTYLNNYSENLGEEGEIERIEIISAEEGRNRRVFSHQTFPRENKRQTTRKRSAFGITMPWFIDSSRPTGDVGLSQPVHGICGLAISWFEFYGLIGIVFANETRPEISSSFPMLLPRSSSLRFAYTKILRSNSSEKKINICILKNKVIQRVDFIYFVYLPYYYSSELL